MVALGMILMRMFTSRVVMTRMLSMSVIPISMAVPGTFVHEFHHLEFLAIRSGVVHGGYKMVGVTKGFSSTHRNVA